jgi:hypothetical protein
MFYVRSAAGLSDDVNECFGTTAPIPNLPKFQPTVFALMENARSAFTQYRVETVQIPSETSANLSPSVLCNAVEYDAAKKKKETVIYKIFFLSDTESHDILRLLYESQVYRYITMNLCWVCRCFVPWYNTYMFPSHEMDPIYWSPKELDLFQAELGKDLPAFKQLFGYFAQQKSIKNIFAQITRREPDDMTLNKALNADQRNTLDTEGLLVQPEAIREIVFQVIFALACMAELQIQHNDLHLGNILIGRHQPKGFLASFRKAKDKNNIGYFFKGKLYEIKDQQFQVRLFDWDHAYVPSMGQNHGLLREHLVQFGLGNVFNPRYDLFMFLMHLKAEYAIFKKEYLGALLDFSNFVDDVIKPEIQKMAVKNRLCKQVKNKCVALTDAELTNIKLPHEALQHDYFKQYQRAYTQFTIKEKGIVSFS